MGVLMSECNKCGITDFEITPKQVQQYLETPDKNILEYQTDKMFSVSEGEIICKMCNSKDYDSNKEKMLQEIADRNGF